MNLKEKLAWQYSNEPNSIDEFTPANKLLMKAAYLEGFNKATELAALEFRKSWHRYGGEPFQRAYRFITQDIENVGNEDVTNEAFSEKLKTLTKEDGE